MHGFVFARKEVGRMAILENSRHEKFVQCLIAGMSQRKAYREAFPNSVRWKDGTVDNKASKLFACNEILVRYNELLEESKDRAIMQRKDRMILLSDIANDDSEKTDSRIKAIDTLNKMDGVYTNKVEFETDARVIIVDDINSYEDESE